jgi:hypothetical protein
MSRAWLPRLWKQLYRGNGLSRNVRRDVCPVRPGVESLEDRLTPATFTVNRLGDAGFGSGLVGDIRYCVNEVVADARLGHSDTIQFASGITTITLSQQLVLVGAGSASITINGPGVTLSGAHNTRVFYVNPGGQMILNGLTIENGRAAGDYGGGIYNNGGTVAMSPWHLNNGGLTETLLSAVGDNTVTVDGAGLFNYGGTVVLNQTSVTGNLAGDGGGGIVNSGVCYVQYGSSVSGNHAYAGAGIDNGGTVYVIGSSINSNTAHSNGGGILSAGTVVLTYYDNGNALVPSQVDGNVAGYLGSGNGGGIDNYNSTGRLTLNHADLSGNTAYGNGGGLQNDSGGTAWVENSSTVDGNGANTGAGIDNGATLSVTNTNFEYDHATNIGGGVYNSASLSDNLNRSNFAGCSSGFAPDIFRNFFNWF